MSVVGAQGSQKDPVAAVSDRGSDSKTTTTVNQTTASLSSRQPELPKPKTSLEEEEFGALEHISQANVATTTTTTDLPIGGVVEQPSPVRCKLSPDRCGALRISFRGGGGGGGENELDWEVEGADDAMHGDEHQRFLSPRLERDTPASRRTARRGGKKSATTTLAADAFFYSPRESRPVGDSESVAAVVGGRRVVDFELPFQVAPYVKPLEAARLDFAARCASSTRRAQRWAVECVLRVLASSRDERLNRLLIGGDNSKRATDEGGPGGFPEKGPLRQILASCPTDGGSDEFKEVTAEWTPLPSEVERALESFGARAQASLIDFGKQLRSLAGGGLSVGRARASETTHVLEAAKGTLVAIQRLYAAAASREHATFQRVLEDAVVQSGILGANLSRVLRDLDVELGHCLAAYRSRTALVAARMLSGGGKKSLRRGGGTRAEVEALVGETAVLADLVAQRMESFCSFPLRDAASRLRVAREETKHGSASEKACAVARLLRELKEAAFVLRESTPEVESRVSNLVARAKPVVRSAVALEVDVDALQEELAQETAAFAMGLLMEARQRCVAIGESAKMAFETRLDTALRDRDRLTAMDADAWKNASASLASYENRLALYDRESYYVLLHAKELLDQAVEASWCYDRLRIFADWILLKDPQRSTATATAKEASLVGDPQRGGKL